MIHFIYGTKDRTSFQLFVVLVISPLSNPCAFENAQKQKTAQQGTSPGWRFMPRRCPRGTKEEFTNVGTVL